MIGMTGGVEAGLVNETKIPFVMLAIVDNMANGIVTDMELTVRV